MIWSPVVVQLEQLLVFTSVPERQVSAARPDGSQMPWPSVDAAQASFSWFRLMSQVILLPVSLHPPGPRHGSARQVPTRHSSALLASSQSRPVVLQVPPTDAPPQAETRTERAKART